jgi:Ras GTPase-activating-like protein IQGAP2/3
MLERDRFDALQEALAPHEDAISRLQCHVRGMLERDRFDALRDELAEHEEIFEDFGAHARAALVRRRNVSKKASIATSHEAITRFAAVARSALVRKEFKSIQASLLTASPGLVGFQSRVKANVVRRNHQQLAAALANVQTITSAVGAQSFFRAALSRARKGEQKKEVEFVLPNFVGFQAMARRAYQKGEYEWWSEHLRSNQLVATHLQSLFRGAMVRREFYGRLDHFHRNMQAIIRLQAIRRGKGPREGFNGIRLGKNVKVSTIKNFGHLLDDTDAQFAEEEKLKKLRHDVVETFRTTQVLETDIEDLDQNIGLFAQNIASFQGRNRHEPSSSSSTSFVDPFSTSSLSREAAHKLDLYQQLFYHLQTNVHLLANLCSRLPENASDPTRKLVEDVVLHLYGYGQGRREEYWAMMFFQVRFDLPLLDHR